MTIATSYADESNQPKVSIMEYFRENFGVTKLGDIKWSHAVNSQEKLDRNINNPNIHFIESDIRISPLGLPICAHPPEVESDLKVQDLIERMKESKQGLKLDFKDPEIIIPVLNMIQEAKLSQPVILNADILQGNGGDRPKFNPQGFLALCRGMYPRGLLSLGWTTKPDINFPYTESNIDEMLKLLEGVDEVTYPVRVLLMEVSWPQLKRLLEKDSFSLSLYNNNPLTPEQIEWIKENTDPEKCFYDFIDDNREPLMLI